MTTGIQSELNYKIQVEPAVFSALEALMDNCEASGIDSDQILRAVWSWADEKITDNPPHWLWLAIHEKQQQREAANTVEGEVGRE